MVKNNKEIEDVEKEAEPLIKEFVPQPNLFDEYDLTEIKGIGPKTIPLLQKNEIYSVNDLAMTYPADLALINGISLASANAFVLAAQAFLRTKGNLPQEFISAADLLKRRERVQGISTGCQSLDTFLKGIRKTGKAGIETSAMTEFYGEFGSSKSQLCHTLSVMATLPEDRGGVNGNVFYVDTEGTLRPERLQQICEAKGIDFYNDFDPHFYSTRVMTSSHLESIAIQLGVNIIKYKLRLVIFDSLINLHRAEFQARGTLAERQQRLGRMFKHIIHAAELYNCAVVFTNQVSAKPDAYGDPTQAVGGNIVGHASTYRIYLRKSGANRVAKMIDSPYHPNSEVVFSVSEKGIDEMIKKSSD